MAIVKTYVASDSRNFDFYGFFSDNPTFTNKTSTSYTIVLDGSPANRINVQGTGFTYLPDQFGGFPNAGTTNAAQAYVNGQLVNEISGLSITQEQAEQYFGQNARDVEMDIFKDADNITGSAFVDYMEGFNGNDTIDGGAGNDTLDGGLGLDKMTGGLGNDIFFVDNTGDTVTELAGTGSGTDIVRTTLNAYTLGANVEQVVFQGDGAFTGTGNAADNKLTGGTGDDKFFSDGTGSDTFGGGTGTDAVFYTKAAIGAVINFATGVNGGAAAGDAYGSIEKFFGSNTAVDTMTAAPLGRAVFSGQGGNDVLTGGDNIDQLLGGVGNDTLKGGGAIDQLTGGLGNDVMDGGAGRDQFVFAETQFGKDTIRNFEDGQDRLKVFSAVANDLSDFAIAGQGTDQVVLTLKTDATKTITLDGKGGALITISAADFLFY